MYKMLIVEDDVFYRYEIRNFMDWEAYGFQVIGEAMNGKCALDCLKEEDTGSDSDRYQYAGDEWN